MGVKSEFIAHHRASDKATQALSAHLLAVAIHAKQFAGKIGLPLQGELIGLVHDLGKYSDEFQTYLKSAVGLLDQDHDEEFVDASDLKGKIDHSTAGAQFIWQALKKQGQLGQIVGQALALCVASHHCGLIDCLTSDERSLGEDAFSRRVNKTLERTHLPEALVNADATVQSRIHELVANPAILATLREAIANIVHHAPGKEDKAIVAQQQIGLLVRFLFSCLIDADRIDTSNFEKPAVKSARSASAKPEWALLTSRLEDHLDSLQPELPIDRLRQDISNRCRNAAFSNKGAYSLTVPTGGGKTLASLRFALHHAKAHHMDRVMYFIPFTSIIDQNAEAVRRILEPQGMSDGVVLEHHSNLTPEEQSWRAKVLTENWDAPIVFTTNVQLLETLFGAGTRGARRMHQLANAVLIFDEIQTLPVNCVHLFNNSINFLVEQCGSTVVLCTATQPLLHRVDSAKGALKIRQGTELMPDVTMLFDTLKRVDVVNRRKPGGWANGEIVELALEETSRSGSCLVVVNTKEAARTLYRLCQGKTQASMFHLSTHMCSAHRQDVLARMKARLDPNHSDQVLCFSTQLIEAGVDIDFGAVIRFAAGLDSVAQAAGRCNRHGRRPTGSVHVVNARDENLERLLDIRVGRDTAARVVDDYEQAPERFGGGLLGPAAMEWYYANYFFARAKDMSYAVTEQSVGHDDNLLNLLSINSIAVDEYARRNGQKPNVYLRQSFMAAARAFKAIDAPTRGVLVPYGAGREIIAELCAAHEPEKEFELLRRAQRFSVNVFPHVLNRLERSGAVREIVEGAGIVALAPQFYSREFGLCEDPVEEMELLYA